MGLKRGDIVIAAAAGDYGKPRPYVVVQSDALIQVDSVILCPITSDVQAASFRLQVQAGETTGLRVTSEIMVEKILAVRRERIQRTAGRVEADTLSQLDGLLALVLGLRG